MKYPFPDNSDSYWFQNQGAHTFPELNDAIEVDVTVIGGGITGIVTAYELKKAGYTVAVLEQNTIASGTTGGTTGKVTSQHGLSYSKLIKKFGHEKAKLYGTSYEQALRGIEQVIKNESIECGFSTQDNYVYTARQKQVETFKQEAKDAASLNLPATFETSLDLPFDVQGAVKFSNQARLNAYDFTTELASRIVDEKNFIFEHSKATGIHDGNPCRVETQNGSIISKHIVITTLIPPLPLVARFSYAAYEYPETSYIVAATLKDPMKGMYISPDPDHYSLLPFEQNGEKILLVGGGSHIPGLGNAKKQQQKLSNYAQKWFSSNKTTHAWGAMDYMAYDGLPLIGKVYPWSVNLFTVTGLKKWGLAGSMVGAKVILSSIRNDSTEEARLFTPHRISAPLSIPQAALNYLLR